MLRIFGFALFQELVLSISRASEESTEFIYSAVVKLQVYMFRLTLKYIIFSITFFIILSFGFHSTPCCSCLYFDNGTLSVNAKLPFLVKVILILPSQLLNMCCQV